MNDLPLVSIVTPSFNQVAYLEKAMLSVLDQEYPNMEYLVVDGGSTDGSVDLIRKYAKRLAWWVSERDSGQADGINKGLKRARGEILAWLNSDDMYTPGAIAEAVSALQRNPDVGMVYSDVRAIDASDKLLNVMRYSDWGLEDLMAFCIIGQPGVFMRRGVLAQAGYLDGSYHYILDHQLWIKIARLSGIRHVRAQWAAARYHSGAKNKAQAMNFGREAFRLVNWLAADPLYKDIYEKNRRRIWAGAFRFEAHYLLDGGQPWQALRSYLRCFLQYPLTAMSEWKRIAMVFLTLLGLGKIREGLIRLRGRLLSKSIGDGVGSR